MIKLCLSLMFMVLLVNSVSFDDAQAQEMIGLIYAANCDWSEIQMGQKLSQVSRLYPAIPSQDKFSLKISESWVSFLWGSYINVDSVYDNNPHKSDWIQECNCQVHSGKADALHELFPHLGYLYAVYIKDYPSASIIIVGHSFGGALATLAASHLAFYQKKQLGLITYGSPRVGDKKFYNWFKSLKNILYSYRIVNNEDIVPHYPFQFHGFYHVDQEIWYQNGKRTICRLIEGEDPSCSYSVQSFSFEDHKTYLNMQIDC